VPVAALSNGNADLSRIGIDHHFAFQLGAREHGAAKPAASIFHAACQRLAVEPAHVLHVGDHIEMDVLGAMHAGLRSCWINREAQAWQHDSLRPDLQFDTLTGLADWLDAHASAPAR
jgi:haloacid dehalogenase superfamily, subfamily IA, variant 1 with third motif having Dx(3-4)D or Dx(3-4)E